METMSTEATVHDLESVNASRSSLAEIAKKSVNEFASHALPHEWLEVNDGSAAYPDSLFVDNQNNSHLEGVDLRRSTDYRELMEIEWKFALAEKYLKELRQNSWRFGQAAAYRYLTTRKNAKQVLSKRAELEGMLAAAQSGCKAELPYTTQIATVLTESDTKSGNSSSFDDPTSLFWNPLVSIVTVHMSLLESLAQTSLEIDRKRMVMTNAFACGFIHGCLDELKGIA